MFQKNYKICFPLSRGALENIGGNLRPARCEMRIQGPTFRTSPSTNKVSDSCYPPILVQNYEHKLFICLDVVFCYANKLVSNVQVCEGKSSQSD